MNFADLGLSPVALDLGIFQLRWYALSYVAMIALGWWYLRKLIARPGAPMSRAHADDIVSWIMLGVVAGGRLGYCLVYQPQIWRTPWKVLELWNGGMSLHGGLAGVLLALWWYARRNNLQLLRIYDYIACCTPFGLFLVRIANFVNGELWGRPSDLPWQWSSPAAATAWRATRASSRRRSSKAAWRCCFYGISSGAPTRAITPAACSAPACYSTASLALHWNSRASPMRGWSTSPGA
ncbi:MAG: prolipoprotein diacylglyceryl transferase [Marmoricola sp.]|nr:prolipoprotein diacylglyceryl transferase [Marmoricola sp.]